MKPGDVVHASVTFTCPFCGLDAFACERPLAVGRALPECPTFAQLEPEQYLTAVKRVQITRN